MALSYYSNWEPEFALCDPDQQLQSFPDTWNHQDYFDTNVFFADDSPNSCFLSNGVSYEHSFNPVSSEFDPFRCQKRQRAFDFDQFYFENDQFTNYPVFSSPCLLQEFAFPEIGLPDFPAAAPCAAGGVDGVKCGGGGSLSAQSIAARQRRRRITEKTQELGKLVPGGQKMNTAEMLQSAYKYIKFLQAQVGILGLISSSDQVIYNENYVKYFYALIATCNSCNFNSILAKLCWITDAILTQFRQKFDCLVKIRSKLESLS